MPVEVQYSKVYLYRRIVQAKLFIDAHFHEPINLDDIADEAYFSKFHFIRLFRKTYGKTPHQYLTEVRIEAAKKMLQTNRPVAQVCYAVGFDSVTSFAGLFKRFTKLTPSLYQLQQQERNRQIGQVPLKFIPGCFAIQKGWIK